MSVITRSLYKQWLKMPDDIRFEGTGNNDLTIGGYWNGLASENPTYIITIDGNELSYDSFTLTKDGSEVYTDKALTTTAQTLADGLTITADAKTGHTLGDNWTFEVRDIDDNVNIDNAIDEAIKLFEEIGLNGRTLEASAETIYRDYSENHVTGNRLWVRYLDLYSVTSITLDDGTVIPDTDYELIPYTGPPYYAIDIHSDSGYSWTYYTRPEKAITIEATCGMFAAGEVPDHISRAVAYLARYLLMERDNTGEVIEMPNGNTVRHSDDWPRIVRDVADKYKRRIFGI